MPFLASFTSPVSMRPSGREKSRAWGKMSFVVSNFHFTGSLVLIRRAFYLQTILLPSIKATVNDGLISAVSSEKAPRKGARNGHFYLHALLINSPLSPNLELDTAHSRTYPSVHAFIHFDFHLQLCAISQAYARQIFLVCRR